MSEVAPIAGMIGGCLCGGVTVSIERARDDVGVCHCRMCRQWTSGPWMALQAPDARIEGETLCVYAATAFAERGFCSVCGAHIFHRPKDGPELAVSAGYLMPTGCTSRARFSSIASRPGTILWLTV